MATNDFRTKWLDSSDIEEHQYSKFLKTFFNEYAQKCFADIKQYFTITIESYEKLIENDDKHTVFESLKEYHDEVRVSSLPVIQSKCITALEMVEEIVKSEQFTTNGKHDKGKKVILANVMAKLAEHRIWNDIYSAFRGRIQHCEQHTKLMFDISRKYSIALTHLIPSGIYTFKSVQIISYMKNKNPSLEFIHSESMRVISTMETWYKYLSDGYLIIVRRIILLNKWERDMRHARGRIVKDDEPNIQPTETEKSISFKMYNLRHKNKIAAAHRKLMEDSRTFIFTNFEYSAIETRIKTNVNKLSADIKLIRKKAPKMMADDKLHSQTIFNDFLDDVNIMIEESMKNLYEHILKDIDTNIEMEEERERERKEDIERVREMSKNPHT